MLNFGGFAPSLFILNGGTRYGGTRSSSFQARKSFLQSSPHKNKYLPFKSLPYEMTTGGTRSSSFQARKSFLINFLQPAQKRIKDSLYEM